MLGVLRWFYDLAKVHAMQLRGYFGPLLDRDIQPSTSLIFFLPLFLCAKHIMHEKPNTFISPLARPLHFLLANSQRTRVHTTTHRKPMRMASKRRSASNMFLLGEWNLNSWGIKNSARSTTTQSVFAINNISAAYGKGFKRDWTSTYSCLHYY